METIYIMWLRQLKLYWRSKSRLIGSIAQPLLFLLALGFGFGPIFEKAGGGNYILFLTPGIIGMTILFRSMFNGISLIWDKKFGFLKESLVAPVSRFKILLGRTLGGATIAVIQALIILAISMLIGFRIKNFLLFPLAFLFMFLISILFTLIGTIFSTKLEDMQAFPLIMNFLIMPIFFLSGALFPLKELPKAILIITKLNPLSYGIDGLRGTLVNGMEFGLITNLIVLVIICIVLLIIGNYAFEKIEG